MFRSWTRTFFNGGDQAWKSLGCARAAALVPRENFFFADAATADAKHLSAFAFEESAPFPVPVFFATEKDYLLPAYAIEDDAL